MVNRENYLLIKFHLQYLSEILQISTQSVERYWFYLRHLLLWADETHLHKAQALRPTFPAYVSSLTGRRESEPLAATTQKKIIETAKRFFTWTKTVNNRDFTSISPAWIDTLRPSRRIQAPLDHVYVTLEEVIQLVNNQIDEGNLALKRDQAAAAMLFLTGMRAGAFTSLPLKAVNLPDRTIYQWPELGVQTKNGKRSTTFMLPIPELLAVVEKWDNYVRTLLPDTSPWYAPVISQWGEQALSHEAPGKNRVQALNKRLKELYRDVGLPPKSAHKFRHGHAVYGLQHAKTMADYKAVSMNLMHHDIEITDSIYAPILSNEVKERIAGMSTLTETPRPATLPDDDLRILVRNLTNEDLSRMLRILAERLEE